MYHFNRPGVNALTQYLQQQQAPFAGMHQAMRNQPVNLGAMPPGMSPPDPSSNQFLWNQLQQGAGQGRITPVPPTQPQPPGLYAPGRGGINPVPPGPPRTPLNPVGNPGMRHLPTPPARHVPPGMGGGMAPGASAPGGGGTIRGATGQIVPQPAQPGRPGVDVLRRALMGMGGMR